VLYSDNHSGGAKGRLERQEPGDTGISECGREEDDFRILEESGKEKVGPGRQIKFTL
jgi:hypothetical protein